MVKIVNGVIQNGNDCSDAPPSDASETVTICGYKLSKWMPVAAIVAAFVFFGFKGMFLLAGALFIGYTMSNGSTGSVNTQVRVIITTLSLFQLMILSIDAVSDSWFPDSWYVRPA